MGKWHKKGFGVVGGHGDTLPHRYNGKTVPALSLSSGVGLGDRFGLPRLGAASKIPQADLGEEPWSVCSLEDMEKRICAGHHFLGVVASIVFDLK